jgi:hypothetical protein
VPTEVTLGIAAWGAALSTVLAIRDIWRDRPRVKVKVGGLVDASDPDGVEDYWWVRVVNVRSRPLEVTAVGLRMKRPGEHYDLQPIRRRVGRGSPEKLPVPIGPGQSVSFYFDRDGDGLGAEKVVGAFARDMLDKTYRGRVRELTPVAVLARYRLERRLKRLRARSGN